jgi:integrase
VYLQQYPGSFFVLSKSGHPGMEQIAIQWLNLQHRKVLEKLKIRGHYAFYSWKHTGAVKAVQAGINVKDLQLQLRHHSLDMVNEYLKNMGVMDSKDLKGKFPDIFGNDNKKYHSANCSAIIDPGYKYCPKCGTQVNCE